MVVAGFGTVQATVEVEISPQVSGNVVSINSQFKAGGYIRADESLFKIDPRDYELVVQQARAGVAAAGVKLDMEKAEAAVALVEWRQLHPDTEPDSPLVLREPQIKQAQALLTSAEAALAAAKLSLERTSVKLPINVRVTSESVDLGQFCSAGRAVGTAYGVETVEIEVPLEDKELAWFDIPDENMSYNGHGHDGVGATAEVKVQFAGAERIRQGYVARTTGQVDATSRLVSVVVEVPRPFDNTDNKPPLLPGMFAKVTIIGKTLTGAIAVPRETLHNGDEVWVVNNEKLRVIKLDIVRTDKDFVYVRQGLVDGELIVISSLDAVVDGMDVRIEE
jgi:RND family efflux transporter MFP subunit